MIAHRTGEACSRALRGLEALAPSAASHTSSLANAITAGSHVAASSANGSSSAFLQKGAGQISPGYILRISPLCVRLLFVSNTSGVVPTGPRENALDLFRHVWGGFGVAPACFGQRRLAAGLLLALLMFTWD